MTPYLLQVTAPVAGPSIGATLAMISAALVILGVVYRVGQATAKQEASERRTDEKLVAVLEQVTKIAEAVTDFPMLRRDVTDLQADMETVRERTHDLSDDITPLYVHAGIALPDRRHRGDRRAS